MALRGNKTLTGTWAEVWFNGYKLMLLKKIDLKVEVQREDVQVGVDLDSKMTGLKGSGTVAIRKVYTEYRDQLEDLFSGVDTRNQLIAKLKDPDAVGGQTERWSVDNVWFNTIPVINWETGAVIEDELEIGFTPSDLTNLDAISA